MRFTELPHNQQLELVSEALHALVSEQPEPIDYLTLCRVARDVAAALELAVLEQAKQGWTAVPEVVQAA